MFQVSSAQVSREALKDWKLNGYQTGEELAVEIYRHFNERGAGGGAPEQDCNAAIAVCQDTYSQAVSYSGEGSLPDEVGGGNCLSSGELNSVWYIWTVTQSGTLSFEIDPNDFFDDYDFAVYDLTGRNCSNVPGIQPVRCNYSAADGPTGLSSSGTAPSVGAGGSPWSTLLNVTAGETYTLIVSNFSSSQSGYSLTFGGTSEIFDETPPDPSSVLTPCGVNYIELTTSEAIQCNTISASGSEFTLTGPGGPFTVTGAAGVNCGTATPQIEINISPMVIIGETYTLTINTGDDSNTLIDNCDNEMPNGTSFQFVAVPNSAEITGPSQVCAGSPVTLTASDGLEYEWSNGATTQSITVSPTVETTYTVTVTSGTCVQTASQTVSIRPSPIADFSISDDTPCEDEAVSFTNNSEFLMSCLGLGIDVCDDNSQCSPFPCLDNPTTILYDFGDGSTSVAANPNHTYADPGMYDVTLTVTDFFNGCSNTVTFPVNVLAGGGSVSLPGPQEICQGEEVTITASGGASYSWTSNPPGFTSTSATITVSPDETTTYMVSAPGCDGDLTGSVTVTVNPQPNVDAVADDASICLGLTTTLTASGAQTYLWSPPNGLNMTTGPTVEASPSTTTQYTVTGTDANGCTNTATVEVEIVEEISAEISADAPLIYCEDEGTDIDVNLDAGPGYTSYMWNTGGTGQTINVTMEGVYYVTVMDDAGCTAYDTVVVSLVPEVVADAGDDTEICSGTSVNLTASGGDTYSWNPTSGLNNPSGATTAASPETTTTYEVTVSVGTCVGTDQVTVTVLPPPVIEAGTNTTILPGESVQLSASGGVSYSWSPADGLDDAGISNPIAMPEETTVYTVTVTDADGCTATEQVAIVVSDDECPLTTLFVPNAFSPNNDGQNDVLYVRLNESFDRMSFRIYNRWGELVFETDNTEEGWDGRYDGKIQSGGVFAYYLEVQCADEIKQRKGNITVIR